MPKQKKICRVCGKEYEACNTRNTGMTFRWQDVSCSPECGAEYLRRVQVARGIIPETNKKIPSENDESSTFYNEEFNGFEGDAEEEYAYEFGSEDSDLLRDQ